MTESLRYYWILFGIVSLFAILMVVIAVALNKREKHGKA